MHGLPRQVQLVQCQTACVFAACVTANTITMIKNVFPISSFDNCSPQHAYFIQNASIPYIATPYTSPYSYYQILAQPVYEDAEDVLRIFKSHMQVQLNVCYSLQFCCLFVSIATAHTSLAHAMIVSR